MPREYPAHPLIGVGAVVLRGASVLLIRRGHPPRLGEWSLPGGLQEVGETVFEAAAREVMEEAGVAIRALAVVDVVDLIEREPGSSRIRYHYTLIDVLAAWTGGDPAAAGDADAAMWVAEREVAGLVRWSETARIVGRACRMYEALVAKAAAPGRS